MDIERRSLLKGLATGLAGAAVAPGTAEAAPADAPAPALAEQPTAAPAGSPSDGLLDDHQRRTLASLADLILPGSVAAGAVDLVDRVAAVESPDAQRRLTSAIGRFDLEARSTSDRRWLDLDEAAKIALLERASGGAPGRPEPPAWTPGQPVVVEPPPTVPATLRDDFDFLKGILADAYVATEGGMKALGWTGRATWRELPGCTHSDPEHGDAIR